MAVAKEAFIELAAQELERSGHRVNVNRISAATGIYRDEVTRIYKKREPAREEPAGILWRVVGAWEQDRRFRGTTGKPRVLSYVGENSEFQRLTESVSKHLNYRTILAELERINVVERTSRGAKLVRGDATLQPDAKLSMELVADDFDTLLQAAEENVLSPMSVGNHHLSTEYDNISSGDVPQVRRWLLKEGRAFHKRARNFLAKFDQDVSPNGDGSNAGSRTKVRLASFSYTSPFNLPRRDDSGKKFN